MDRSGWRCLGSATLAAFALTACSIDQVGGGSDTPLATGGVSPGGASGATGGGVGDGGGSNNGNAGCTSKATTAELPAIDLFVVLDASEAMYLPAGSASTRWIQVGNALLSFFRDPASAGLGVDLGFFPALIDDIPDSCTSDDVCGEGAPCVSKICLNVLLELDQLAPCNSNADCEYGTTTTPLCRTIGDCSSAPGSYCFTESPDSCDGTCTQSGICTRFVSCRTAAYAEPDVSLTVLPEAQALLAGAIQGREPGEDTSTAPALAAAIERAGAWAADHPDHEVVVVLATGGLPTACFEDGATREQASAELAALAASAAQNGLRTHVIGVLSEREISNGEGALLDSLAEAGGTERAVVIDAASNVSTAVSGALTAIRGPQRGCEFQAVGIDDYDRVNVVLRSNSGAMLVPRVRDAGSCDGARGGWHYDVDPASADPKRIALCATSCVELRLAQGASVEFEIGCASRTLD